MTARSFDLTLYAITDHRAHPAGLAEPVAAAIEGGATMVQLRYKGSATRPMVDAGRELASLARRMQIPLVINDRIDVMWAVGADGVHVGPDDMPPELARRLIGPNHILGVSAGTPEEARKAEAAGADYVGVGSVFSTQTKADAGDPIGVAGLAEVVRATALPVVAIGGITIDNAGAVVAAGAAGVAVVSAVFGRSDVAGAAAALRTVLRRAAG